MTIDIAKPVLVTGATGYVAGQLIKRLLDEGLTVHATVRDPSNSEKLQHLTDLAENSKGNIVFFAADLLTEGAFEQAMAGCRVVFHTASPFTLNVTDPQTQLVAPAVNGTRNVLNQACKTPSVTRVVVTSSCAAIYGDNVDLLAIDGEAFTEQHWNTASSLSHNPYSYSKTQAEKAAWEIAKQQSQWDLVTINPSFVIGPGIKAHREAESFKLIKEMGNGKAKVGLPDIGMGAVDVRDVAEAHFQAGFNPNAKGRYITSGHNTSFLALAAALLEKYGATYPIPKTKLPKWLVWLVGPLADKALTRTMVSRNVGYPWVGDNSKIRNELGVEFRPLNGSMEEMFQQMIDQGLL